MTSWREAAEQAQQEQLALPTPRVKSRRRRLLEQFDEHDPALSIRELVRSVENMIGVSPGARGRPWPRPYERHLDDG